MFCLICRELEAELDRLSRIHFDSRVNKLSVRGKGLDLEQQQRQQAERVANIHRLDAQFDLAGHQRKVHPVQKHFTAGV